MPRRHFLGKVVDSATGADETRSKVIAELEEAELTVLPPEIKLRPSAGTYQEQVVVQPDASLLGPSTFTLIEAKRLRQGSFQEEQLAREYVSVTLEAGGRVPLLLLIIPSGPRVHVKRLGQVTPEAAIETTLEHVLDKTERHPLDLVTLTDLIPQTIAWVTWDRLGAAVQNAHAAFTTENDSVAGTINRLCDLIAESIHRHGDPSAHRRPPEPSARSR